MASKLCKCTFRESWDCFGRYEVTSEKFGEACRILNSMPRTQKCPFYKPLKQHLADQEKYPYNPVRCSNYEG